MPVPERSWGGEALTSQQCWAFLWGQAQYRQGSKPCFFLRGWLAQHQPRGRLWLLRAQPWAYPLEWLFQLTSEDLRMPQAFRQGWTGQLLSLAPCLQALLIRGVTVAPHHCGPRASGDGPAPAAQLSVLPALPVHFVPHSLLLLVQEGLKHQETAPEWGPQELQGLGGC